MDLSNLKKLVFFGLAAGVSVTPVVAEEVQSIVEADYYAASCGNGSCRTPYIDPSSAPNGQPSNMQPHNNGNAPPTYNQTNPAPTAVPQPKTATQGPNAAWYEKGMAPQSQGMHQQPAQPQAQPKADGSTTSRYYQKRDRELSDASMDTAPAPHGKPSNGVAPGKPSNGLPPSGQPSAMKPAKSNTNSSSKY